MRNIRKNLFYGGGITHPAPTRISEESDDLECLCDVQKRHGIKILRGNSKWWTWTVKLPPDDRLDVICINGIWMTTDTEFKRFLDRKKIRQNESKKRAGNASAEANRRRRQ